MLGNSHVQFLGRSGPATGRSYPTGDTGARGSQPVDRRDDQGCRGEEASLYAGEGPEGCAEQVILSAKQRNSPAPCRAIFVSGLRQRADVPLRRSWMIVSLTA